MFCAGRLPYSVPTGTEETVRLSPVTRRSLDPRSLRSGGGPKGTPHLAACQAPAALMGTRLLGPGAPPSTCPVWPAPRKPHCPMPLAYKMPFDRR